MRDFYGEVIDELLRVGVLTNRMKILVVCGGTVDRSVLSERDFRDVVISNIDPRTRAADFAPFTLRAHDAERLALADESFDFCLVHSGLHHCHSPHRALLEMYRVARKGLLLIEPYDNLVTRLGIRLNVGQEYEHAAVVNHGGVSGGVGNSHIPNYIYRWTEKEIVKTVHCYAPYARHDIRFFYKLRIPWTQLRRRRNKSPYLFMLLAQPAFKLLERIFPKQSNNFAALVVKPELPSALHPWLVHDGESIQLNDQWLSSRYQR